MPAISVSKARSHPGNIYPQNLWITLCTERGRNVLQPRARAVCGFARFLCRNFALAHNHCAPACG